MRYLILLNRKFPYKSGETFLENEIEEISKYFDKILIYPSDAAKNEKQTREIKAKNVEVRLVEKTDFRRRKFLYLAKSILQIKNCKTAKGFKNKFSEAYFLAAAQSQASKIRKDLDDLNITSKDEIYLYSYWLYINAKVACLLKDSLSSQSCKLTAFSRAHGFDIYEERQKNGFLPHRTELLKNLDLVFPCSENGTKYLIRKYPTYKDKIQTSYLGTYDHGFRKFTPHTSFNILSCSRATKVKRIHLIIEALETLKNDNLDITWTHIGGGDLLNDLKKDASEKLNWMKVSFLGQKTNAEVYNYYLKNNVDLFINVSSSEGLPVSIMEVASFGIPVIATDVGGTSEIVINDKNGYILPENFTSHQLTEVIKNIAEASKRKRIAMRNQSRRIWEENFQATKNYMSFCNNILGGNNE